MTTDAAADTMKAVYFEETGGTDVLRFGDVPRPQPGNGQALVRVLACGVNRLDIYARTGRTPVKLPHISGSEATGEVVGYGPGVATEPVPVGKLAAIAPYLFCGQCEFCLAGEETLCIRGDILGLASQGAFAEYVVVPASSLVPLPNGVSAASAAAVGLAMITAWRMLIERAKVQPGETVLVQAGGSGVGSAAIQIAKLAGARVIATVGSREKMEHAQRLGADNVINYNELDFAQEVRKLTGKRGVSVVVEHIGAATWAASMSCLARKGRLVTCGATTGNEGTTNIWNLFAKELMLIGSYGGTRTDLATVLRLVANGQLQPVITRTLPLESIAEAQRLLEEREVFGKIVIDTTK
ncbi:MAG TPA: zinc-binding dehydrogenase [Ktedonobacterales bacterium]|jgi:NADPH:quinone reductase-like Zn-dependent oxidoreductase|nr:zinc-binding dehydrogenase [Ktedonobacterales bacterium]